VLAGLSQADISSNDHCVRSSGIRPADVNNGKHLIRTNVLNMATAAVSSPTPASTFTPQIVQSTKPVNTTGPRDVHTTLNYHKPNEDGSPPHPTYVDRPETYDRPFESFPIVVKDVRGRENEYSLDSNGFQIYNHPSIERDFLDDEQIKNQYYKETEQLLKDA